MHNILAYKYIIYRLKYAHIPTYLMELNHTIFALTIGGKLDAMELFHTMLNEIEASSISLVKRIRWEER